MKVSHIFTTSSASSFVIIKFLLAILIFVSNPKTFVPAKADSSSTVPATPTTYSSVQNYEAYIKKSCSSTIYQNLCYVSLSPYASNIKANPQKLCNTAMIVTLNAANNASSTASNLVKQKLLTRLESQIVKDCIGNIKDSVYQLKKSMKAMSRLSRSNAEFQMSSVKTWISAAMTDQETCTDAFYEENISANVKNKIRNGILNVSRLTSNALALVNDLKY